MNKNKWLDKNCPDLTGKTIFVSGSTGGLASEFVKLLAQKNANFVFANRNLEKSEKQKQELLTLFPNIKIDIFQVDFFQIKSVKNLCKNIKNIQIDYLILNSAIYNVPLEFSNLGFNNVFQTNFVSQYYLIKQLLQTLKESNSKVIVISSIAHNYCKINPFDIDYSKSKSNSKIYGNSKRFLMFSLEQLFENQNINFAIVHPGVTLTKMTNHYPKAINGFVKIGIKLFFPSAKQACKSIIYGINNSTKCGEWIGPKILNIYGNPK